MENVKKIWKKIRSLKAFQDPFVFFLILTSLVVVTVFIIYPLFCILKTSVYYKGVFSLDTFKSTLDSEGFKIAFWNSMKLAVCILLGQLVFGVPSAWALARFDFPCRKAVMLLYIVLMLMPFQVLMLPEYLVLNEWHLIDTHAAVIFPAIFSTFPVFIMYRGFRGIPEEILDAGALTGRVSGRFSYRSGCRLAWQGSSRQSS